MTGILTKNVVGGAPLAVVDEGNLYCGTPVVIPQVLPCPKRTVINLATPYKTMTGAFEVDTPVLMLPDLPANSDKLIDCAGTSHIAVYALVPEATALLNIADTGVIGGYLIGYTANDATKSLYCPTWVVDFHDNQSPYTVQKDSTGNPQLIKTVVGGATYAAGSSLYLHNMGFEKVQLLFCDPKRETGVTFTGSIKVYCVAF